jgi:hypothetical protein
MIESMVDKERNRREKPKEEKNPKVRHTITKLLKAFTVAGNLLMCGSKNASSSVKSDPSTKYPKLLNRLHSHKRSYSLNSTTIARQSRKRKKKKTPEKGQKKIDELLPIH